MKCLWGQGNRYLRITRKRVDISPMLARIVLAGILVAVGMIFLLGDVGLWNLWKAQRRIEAVQSRIDDLEGTNIVIAEQIERLQSDPFAIEKVARERYGYLRPGDRVYRIITLPVDVNGETTVPSSLDRDLLKP
jgi:cell division protein FtsB